MAENKKLRGNRIELPNGDYFYAPDTMASNVIGLTDVVDNRVTEITGILDVEDLNIVKDKVDVLDAAVEQNKDDIIDIQNDLLTKGTDIEALDKRVTDNETVIEEIGSDIDSIDEDIDAIETDIAKIKTDFMETSDYLEGGEFKDIYLTTVNARIDTLESTPGTDVDEVQGLIDTSLQAYLTEVAINAVLLEYSKKEYVDGVESDLQEQIDALVSGSIDIVDIDSRDELPTSNQKSTIIYWIKTDIDKVYEQVRWSDTKNEWLELGTTEAVLADYIKTVDAEALVNTVETSLNNKISTLSSTTSESIDELRTYVDNLPTGTDEDKVNELINDKIENVAYTNEENIFTEEQKFEAGLKVIAETGICIEADGTDKCTTIVGYDDGDNGIKSEIVMGGDLNFNTNGYTVLINDVEIGRGNDGEDAYDLAVSQGYVGSEIEWIASLKGDTGDTGAQGVQGIQGATGEQGLQGPEGPQGPQGIAGENGEDGTALKVSFTVDTYDELLTKTGYVYNNEIALCTGDSQYYTYVENASNGNQYGWTILPNVGTGVQGIQGEPGIQGPQGEQGPAGPQGEQGVQGIQGVAGNDGERGASAYEIAVSNGWQTTEELWLESLNGSKGSQGIQGLQGQQGIQGIEGPQGPAGWENMTSEWEVVIASATYASGQQYTMALSEPLTNFSDFRSNSAWIIINISSPDNNYLRVGNIGIASATAIIYGKRNQGQIMEATGLVGPQGIQGIQGEQGVAGPQGPAGNDGQDGFVNEAMYWDLIKRLEALENK